MLRVKGPTLMVMIGLREEASQTLHRNGFMCMSPAGAVEGNQALAVGAEVHAVSDAIGRPFQRDQAARGEVPEQDRVIATARGQSGAVGTECRRGHLVRGAV